MGDRINIQDLNMDCIVPVSFAAAVRDVVRRFEEQPFHRDMVVAVLQTEDRYARHARTADIPKRTTWQLNYEVRQGNLRVVRPGNGRSMLPIYQRWEE